MAGHKDTVDDLRAAHAELDDLLSGLDERQWSRETPAPGWTVRDQVSHLVWGEEWTLLSVTDPEGFRNRLADFRDPDAEIEKGVRAADHLAPAELLATWQHRRTEVVDRLAALAPGTPLPWFGVVNTATQQLVGRAMETFAHGTDIADAVGARLGHPTLRHVVGHGVSTLRWSFATNGLDIPTQEVRVELRAPDGAMWTFGPFDARDKVSGPALDFALVTVRRRHRADTALRAAGQVADRWLDVAQSYTGSAGPGRRPGQFSAPS